MPETDKAAALGVSTATIAKVANIATLGDSDQSLPKFNQISIRMMLDEAARSEIARIASLQVPANGGPLVIGGRHQAGRRTESD